MIPNLTGSLSSIVNTVPLPGKMTIIPLRDVAPVPIPAGPPYVVMFNPETLDESYEVCYTKKQKPGTNFVNMRFNKVKERTFKFDFLIDGTGASGDKREVIAEIQLFKETVRSRGEFHRPPFLVLVYGSFITTCVLTDMQITYTMFRKNGTPLRAKISASFKEHTPDILSQLKSKFSSPDLTHKRIIREGDSLPLVCNDIYDSPRFYLEVAKANGLTSPRSIRAGQEITLPPIEK